MTRLFAIRSVGRLAAIYAGTTKRALGTSASLWHGRDNYPLKESYDYGSSSIPLLGKTIGAAIQETAERFPDRDAFVYGIEGGKRHTYKQLLEEVDRVAAGFLKIGIKKGDRVGIMGPNIEEWVLTQYATARMGAILVNVNPAYRIHELEYALKMVGMKAIVSPHTYKTQDYYEMLSEICPELNSSKPGEIHCESLPDLRAVIVAGQDNLGGAFKFDDIRDMGGDRRGDIEKLGREIDFDDIANIQFTSGTTGNPKATALTHHGIFNNAYAFGLILGYDKQHEIICGTLPLYHVASSICLSLAAVVHGQTVVLPAPGHEPETNLKAAEKEKCTLFSGTPTIYLDTFNHPNSHKYDTSTVKIGVMGGSPCPPELIRYMKEDRNTIPVIGCGMTEASPVHNMTTLTDSEDVVVNTVGRAFPNVEIKVVDPETNAILPINTKGELCIRGHSVMRGYWNDPEKTAEVVDEAGWLHSGDLAVMDENGYLSIVGRIKDMIIRGGTNLFPVEIENFLHQHPKIANVQVVGVPDKRMGEELCACIQLKEGETSTQEEIREYCKGEISHNKIPRYVEFVDSYPLTATMKVQKFELTRIMTEKLGL